MSEPSERRAYRRLESMLPVECVPADPADADPRRGVSRNIGSGGLYFETGATEFQPGSLWKLQLSVPPGEGYFPYAGQIQAAAEVLRVDDLTFQTATPVADGRRFGVAARFREPLKLHFQDP